MKYRFLFALISLLFLPFLAGAQSESELELLIRESKTRAKLVQRVQQAVVHIKVEKILRDSQGQPLNNPFDLYNDEFFERFFPGMRPPNRQRNPNQNRDFRQEGMGSGSIVRDDGYILTNHHVVGEADVIKVKLYDGTELEAKLVGTDPESDIAVIKVEGSAFPVLPMGNSDEIEVGESVIAVGNPFGLTQTVTFGIVSAKSRSNVGITEYENFIQTDAAINPGNSGGPLISLRGQIVGVNTAIYTRSGGYQGIGFAVPINMARGIMEDLINDGRVARGWLGVGIQDLNQDLAKAFNLKTTKGSLVTGVMRGTPAEKAGLQQGDVVVGLNDGPINDSNQLRNEIANARANAVVELRVLRGGGGTTPQEMTFQVKLDERPKEMAVARNELRRQLESDVPETESVLGLVAQDLNPELGRQFSLEQASGVVITDVEAGSPAEDAGLRSGMVVLEVNRKEARTLEEFRAVLKQVDLQSEGLLLYVASANGKQFFVIRDRR